MSVLRTSTVSLSILFIVGCSSGKNADPPPPPAKTVFDPVTQSMDRARDVQKTIDQHAVDTRDKLDAEERGASTERDNPP